MSRPNWEIFEREVYLFLNENIKIKGVNFEQRGKRNSRESDIAVNHGKKVLFLIESKLSPSQAGQFVILLNGGKYQLSNLNHSNNNEFSKTIVDYINSNINYFEECGTTGKEITLPKEILGKWIKSHYSNKDVRFFITSDSHSNFKKNFIRLIPFDKFEDSFQISAILRRKRSGTQKIPLSDFPIVKKELQKKFGEELVLTKKGIVNLSNLNLKDKYLGKNYYLSKLKADDYQVRKRSSVNNPNVIFSLKYIGIRDTGDFSNLKNTIKDLIK
jgi:hypothetical protein